MNIENFLYQGGYAFFVWGAYGMAALLLGIEVTLLWQRRTTALAAIRRLMRRQHHNHS